MRDDNQENVGTMHYILDAYMLCAGIKFAPSHADAAEVEPKRLITSNAACLRLGQE
jgi:hypothetical protein